MTIEGVDPTARLGNQVAQVLFLRMDKVGLKELRQHASDVVKRAEAGETMLITVAGRPSAVLAPITRNQWRRYDDIVGVFDSEPDPSLAADLKSVDDPARDPWEQ